MTAVTTIGVISDTHGLLRPEAETALQGVDRILHAGDIGMPEILERLETIAPVTAVRGNNDTADWARTVREREQLMVEGCSIYLLHDLKALDIDPVGEGHHVVIAGHSHKPNVEERNGVLYLNPGSAGTRRFTLPVTVALLRITGGKATAQIIELDIRKR